MRKVLSLLMISLWAVSLVGLSERPIQILDTGSMVTETLLDSGNMVIESEGRISSIETFTIHRLPDGGLTWHSNSTIIGETANIIDQDLILDNAFNPISYTHSQNGNTVRSFIQGAIADVTVYSEEGIREQQFSTNSEFAVLETISPSLATFPLLKLFSLNLKTHSFDALTPSAQFQFASTIERQGFATLSTAEESFIADSFMLLTDTETRLFVVDGRFVAGFQSPNTLFYRQDMFPNGLTISMN